MKNKMIVTALAILISGPVTAKTWVLTSAEGNIDKGNWLVSSSDLKIKDKNFSIEQKVLHGGKQEGSKVILIKSKDGLTIALSPTRGMGLLNAEGYGVRLGWNSPVKEVVNPAYINLDSRNGLGWLDGFNEMMVRCGYESAGHPVTADGQIYNLHGKAGNTPASLVEVEVSEKAPYQIKIRGLIKESTFKKVNLQTMTELRYIPGSNSFSIHDVLTNKGDYPHDYQIIYHSNFGSPLLEEGARVLAAIDEISPFNDYAKPGLKSWNVYNGQTRDFDEMLYNIKPLSDNNQKTEVALVNKSGDKGIAIQFDTNQLPYMGLWKNTDTLNQGYVTGLEPGTGYAYPMTIEREQHRVKSLQAGASTKFDLTYTVLYSKEQVKSAEKRVATLQEKQAPVMLEEPVAAYLYTAGPKTAK